MTMNDDTEIKDTAIGPKGRSLLYSHKCFTVGAARELGRAQLEKTTAAGMKPSKATMADIEKGIGGWGELGKALGILQNMPASPTLEADRARRVAELDERARRIGLHLWSVRDALTAAHTIAGRGSDGFSGDEAALLFDNLRRAISEIDDHPAMKAMQAAAMPPSILHSGAKHRIMQEVGEKGIAALKRGGKP